MHAAAQGQLGPCQPIFPAADVGLDATEPVEIVLLSEDRSQQAAHILQERGRKSRPMHKARQILACGDKSSLPSEASSRPSLSAVLSEVQTRLSRSIVQRVPLLTWTQQITCKSLRADLIAGLTVGVMVIPQSMSYANIAGLPYIYGMYAACVPAMVYAIFGQSRQLAVGPVAMVSLLINAGLEGQMQGVCEGWKAHAHATAGASAANDEYCKSEYIKMAIFTSLVMGLMQIVAMVLRMGFLVTFLGHPVTSGFTSGAAIIIGLSQVKYMVGVHLPKSQYVYVTVYELASQIQDTKFMTLLLGSACLVFLFCAKEVSRRYPRLSLLGPLAPLLCCAAGTILLWLCTPLRETYEVSYVGENGGITPGIFPVSLDAWDFSNFSKVLPTALSCCLIGYMESIAIGKNLAAKHGYELEPGQESYAVESAPNFQLEGIESCLEELLALGLANVVGALPGSQLSTCPQVRLPGPYDSPSDPFRSQAVNNATGAVTQLSGLITALVIVCTLLFLTRLFDYLPDFVLAAIVISSVAPLVAYREAGKLWRVKKQDFFLWVAAFLGTLFLGVLQGME
ncbi:unnamed protein product [Effrenium voratum]|nr:unnamed protein product [Effrenium voratum]